MATHHLRADERTVRVGVIDAAHPPVLTVDSGDEVVMETWSHWAGQVAPGMGLDDVLELRAGASLGPHSITGPIEVASAEPGDVLQVDVLELRPGEWGFNLALPAPLGRGVLAERFPVIGNEEDEGFPRTIEVFPGLEHAAQRGIAAMDRINDP